MTFNSSTTYNVCNLIQKTPSKTAVKKCIPIPSTKDSLFSTNNTDINRKNIK